MTFPTNSAPWDALKIYLPYFSTQEILMESQHKRATNKAQINSEIRIHNFIISEVASALFSHSTTIKYITVETCIFMQMLANGRVTTGFHNTEHLILIL